MAEWDAARYHWIADPPRAWGRMVAAPGTSSGCTHGGRALASDAADDLPFAPGYRRLNIAARKRVS